jgi:hypothetical protein
MRYLAEMCPHREALRWLVRQVVNYAAKWPGLAEVRGILCTRYDPADGIDGYSTIPGYRADDAEMRYILREQQMFAALPPPAVALAQLAEPGPADSEQAPRIPALKQLPNGHVELKPTPLKEYELNVIRGEADDERLSAEARERARRILERMEQAG